MDPPSLFLIRKLATSTSRDNCPTNPLLLIESEECPPTSSEAEKELLKIMLPCLMPIITESAYKAMAAAC